MGKRLDHSASLRALGDVIAAAQQQALTDGEQLALVRERLLASAQPAEAALDRLGLHVGDTQEEVLAGENHLHRVRAMLLAPPARPSSRTPLWGGLALAGASAAVLLAYLMLGDNPSLRYRIDGRDAEVGAWIAPQGEKTARMTFSDGSQIELGARSNGRVQRLDERGAHFLLERGAARVSVQRRRRTHWELSVGPFDVTVVGTRFAIAWDPEREVFALELEKGAVRVKGPALKQRVVSAGEQLRVWVRQGKVQHRPRPTLVAQGASKGMTRMARAPGPPKARPAASKSGRVALSKTPPSATSAVAPPAVSVQSSATAEETKPLLSFPGPKASRRARSRRIAKRRVARKRSHTRRAPRPRGTAKVPLSIASATTTLATTSEPEAKVAPPPTPPKRRSAGPWDLARAGRYKEAMAASAKEGWGKIVSSASAKQLLILADAARLAGMSGRARKLYLVLRSRFHGSPQAAAAAFALGRLAFDRQKDPAAAARYFERYLAEEPRGPLAKAALGRLMEARVRAGQWDFACATARSYLLRFSGGAHTRLAQRIVARCAARP